MLNRMKIFTVLGLAFITLVAGCASQEVESHSARITTFDEDAPTGSSIKRRPVKESEGDLVKSSPATVNPTILGTFEVK